MIKKLKSMFDIWKTKPKPEPEELRGIIALTENEIAFLADMIVNSPPPRNLPPLKRQHAQTLYLSVYKKIVLGGVQK